MSAYEDTTTPSHDDVDVRVRIQWEVQGLVVLDGKGELNFGPHPTSSGLYRLTLIGASAAESLRYIGQTDNLRRRLSTNYRRPSSGQQTSLRISELLVRHLLGGGTIELAIATQAAFWVAGEAAALDLVSSAGRKLAERAAIAVASLDGGLQVLNRD